MSLPKDKIKNILKAYEETKAHNERKLRIRKSQIYKTIPELKDIENRITRASINMAKAISKTPARRMSLLKQLKEELAELKATKAQLLEEYGYPSNYLEPIYTCEKCKDTGYIDNKKCTCFKQLLIDIAYQQSNLKDTLDVENFSNFSFDYYSDDIDDSLGISPLQNIKSVYIACENFVDEFNTSFSNLILYGQAGLGKTFLCNCIAKELLDASFSVIYLSAFQLFKLLETYQFKNEDNLVTFKEVENIYNCDLLIIDDLGSEITNSFRSSELFNCLNVRMLNKKSTVISTNLEPSNWSSQYSNRIVSRIFGNYIPLKLIGNDIRLQKYR